MKYLTLTLLLFFTVIGKSQQYEHAIVTDLNFLRRSNIVVTDETFPFYFHHKAFATDVQNEIRLLLNKKYGIKNVLFFTPDSITYRDQPTAWDTQAKEYALGTQRPNTLFVSVETILQTYTQIDQERTYRFTTRLKIYDENGKLEYKFKNHIPFTPVYGDPIAGTIDLGEEDFYSFYFDGLNYAFEGKITNTDKRFVIKPTAENYLPFTFDALKVYLETENNGYGYGRDFSQLSELVHFTINYWKQNSGESFEFLNLATIDFLDGGYNIINRLDEKEYSVRMKGGVNSLKSTYDPFADIVWEVLQEDGEVIGEMTFDGKANLTGTYNGQSLSFKWQSNYSCLEVYFDKELLALINYSSSSKVLYLSQAVSREQLIKLTNSLFVYDYSQAVRKKIVISYD